jgi:hypothetical protein
MDHQNICSGAAGSRINVTAGETPSFCLVPRALTTASAGPLKQELQGVALRRTCRGDGVMVGGPSVRRRPSAAHRNTPLRGGGGEARDLRGGSEAWQRCLDVPAGVETR